MSLKLHFNRRSYCWQNPCDRKCRSLIPVAYTISVMIVNYNPNNCMFIIKYFGIYYPSQQRLVNYNVRYASNYDFKTFIIQATGEIVSGTYEFLQSCIKNINFIVKNQQIFMVNSYKTQQILSS
jgi:hypothetical protein